MLADEERKQILLQKTVTKSEKKGLILNSRKTEFMVVSKRVGLKSDLQFWRHQNKASTKIAKRNDIKF